MAAAQIAEWQKRAEAFKPLNLKQIEGPIAELDAHLTLRSYIVGYSATDADLDVWKAIRGNRIAHSSVIKQGLYINVSRWFNFIEETERPVVELASRGKEMAKKAEGKADQGNYDIGLEGT
ncbi:hypothetical protein KCU59_g16236, partial [Aureobasidium melanogenum]